MGIAPADMPKLGLLAGLAVEIDPLLRLGEQIEDLVPFQRADGDKVTMRERPRARREAAAGDRIR